MSSPEAAADEPAAYTFVRYSRPPRFTAREMKVGVSCSLGEVKVAITLSRAVATQGRTNDASSGAFLAVTQVSTLSRKANLPAFRVSSLRSMSKLKEEIVISILSIHEKSAFTWVAPCRS